MFFFFFFLFGVGVGVGIGATECNAWDKAHLVYLERRMDTRSEESHLGGSRVLE